MLGDDRCQAQLQPQSKVYQMPVGIREWVRRLDGRISAAGFAMWRAWNGSKKQVTIFKFRSYCAHHVDVVGGQRQALSPATKQRHNNMKVGDVVCRCKEMSRRNKHTPSVLAFTTVRLCHFLGDRTMHAR